MRQKFQLLYNLSLILSDALAILAAFSLAYVLRVQIDTRPLLNPISAESYFLIYLALMPFWIGVMAVAGLYRRSFYHRFFKELAALTFTAAIGIMALITLDFALDKPLFPARLVPLYAFGLTLTFLKIYESIVNGHNEYRLEGIWMPEPKGNQKRDFRPTQALHIKSFKTALKRITDRHADLVIQTEVLDDESNYQLTSAVESVHARYKLIPSNSSLYGIKTTTDLFFGIPSLDVHITPLVGWNTVLKRIFDITLSLIILIIASPFLLILAILIKISDFRGPVIYKHSRITRYGKTFYIYKFRSMYWKYCTGQKSGKKKTEIQIFTEMGREDLLAEWAETQKVAKDPRITPIGHIIRKTGIDELAQLINVLQGKLSLIGPRAITRDELKRYKSSRDKFLSVKPGITGLWQVSGRNDLSYEDRVKLDVYYVQNWSLWLDIKILFKTIGTILKGTGN